jgi:8-oxo-dGTP pyrophosphatase MutT (NUDIX family)
MAKNNESKTSKEKITLQETVNLPITESAGGLVCNHYHHILLMFKRGKWDMPKGRIEDGQSREKSALREVQEETGLPMSRLTIQGKLVSTWHTTQHQNIKYLKKTHWYLMQYDGDDDDTNPQVEEGIIECRWVHISDLPHYRESLVARINYVVDFWHKNLAYSPRH